MQIFFYKKGRHLTKLLIIPRLWWMNTLVPNTGKIPKYQKKQQKRKLNTLKKRTREVEVTGMHETNCTIGLAR